jgi:sugar/nucleoside kinase (ribokinase family)
MESSSPRYLLAGVLTRETIILPSGQALLDVPGGGPLYAAAGLAVWEPQPPPVILARVGEDYPQEWLDLFERKGLDVRGIHVQPQSLDLRHFAAYTSRTERSYDDPVSHFARLGLPFPRGLLGYRAGRPPLDSRTRLLPTSLRQADLTPDLLEGSAAHLCPVDFLSHSLIPAVLRQAQFTTVTLDPSPGYMDSAYWNDLPGLVNGLTAFLPSEEEALCLFQGRTSDPWEMCAALAAYGCEIIVIKRGERGQYVYDAAAKRRWEIPPYPARLVDPGGAGDAFCGGFLSGYRRNYDPLEAALYGNVSASLVVEGSGPFYAMEALPGLAQARLEALRQSVRRM